MRKRLAVGVVAAALLTPGAAAAHYDPEYGTPRAMPSDYAAAYGLLPRPMPSDYARAGVKLTPQAGMPRAMSSDYDAYFGSQGTQVGGVNWPSAGIGAGITLSALLAAALAVALRRVRVRKGASMNALGKVGGLVALAAAALALALTPAALAHNRAHVILPSGKCIIVGSEKSVTLPDGTLLDLRPETTPADEFGTAFAADEGNSALRKGACP